MTTVSLTTPAHVGTRDLVRAWLEAALDQDIAGAVVEVDCAPLRAPSSSFIDELIKVVLVERAASRLRLNHASDRARSLAGKSARNFGVLAQLDMQATVPQAQRTAAFRLLRPRLSR